MSSISSFLSKNAGPCEEVVKGKVVACLPIYTYSAEDKQVLTVAMADSSAVVKVSIYDKTKFGKFKEGSSVSVRNVIKRSDNTLVITKNSRVFMTPDIVVDEERVAAGHRLLNPPPADFVTLEKGLSSPVKTCVSIRGEIVQEDKQRDVMVNRTPTKLKEIYLKDNTVERQVKVTLWRNQGETDVRPGDFVSITNVVTSTYKGEVSFSTTSRSEVKRAEAPLEEKNVTIEGVCVEDEEMELLCDDGEVMKVALSILSDIIPAGEDPEAFMCQRMPQKMRVFVRGATVDRVVFC